MSQHLDKKFHVDWVDVGKVFESYLLEHQKQNLIKLLEVHDLSRFAIISREETNPHDLLLEINSST